MMPRYPWVGVAMLLMAMAGWSGQARAESVSMMGQGILSCLIWTQSRDAKLTEEAKVERAGEEAWIVGFLSGAGAYAEGKDPLDHIDIQDVLDFADAYCLKHPSDRMVNAGLAFVDSRDVPHSSTKGK